MIRQGQYPAVRDGLNWTSRIRFAPTGTRATACVDGSSSTENIDATLSAHGMIFGSKVPLPAQKASFAFGVPNDGSLPLDGIAPSIIDHYSDTSHFAAIPDMGARLRSFTIEHPDPTGVVALYRNLAIDHPPTVIQGQEIKYRAFIDTRTGSRELS